MNLQASIPQRIKGAITALFKGPIPLTPDTRDHTRLAHRLVRYYQYKVDMNIRNWRAAVAQAKDVYMPGRVELYAMYEDALDDPFLYAAIRTARMKVVSAPFRLVDNQSQTPSDAHTLLLQRPWFDRYAEIFVDNVSFG
jgi:hypothetical protein